MSPSNEVHQPNDRAVAEDENRPQPPESARRRVTVFTSDDPEECYQVMRERRLADRADNSTLVEVRWADPPIRTVHKWAVIRYA